MIGVYDSGFGGLTVLRHLIATLPTRDFLYLGDSARAPYGGRDVDTILDLAEQCIESLFERGCRLVIVACHTVSCVGLRHLQQRYARPDDRRRILGVTIPAAEIAVRTSTSHIGVLATARTVASRTFEIEIAKLGPHRVSQRAAPLLAPIVEEGWEGTDVAEHALRRYLDGLSGIDALLLACTHFPILMPMMRALCPVPVIDPAPYIAERLADWLDRHPSFDDPGQGVLRVQSTSDASFFREHGARFFGGPLPEVERLVEERGTIVARDHVPVIVGQVVREAKTGSTGGAPLRG